MSNKAKSTDMNEDDQSKLVPKLRFPDFREAEGWEKRPLRFACQMQAGKFVAASEIHEKKEHGLYPCYGGNGLRGYTATFTHSGKYSLIGRQGALCGNVKIGVGQFHATEHAVVVTPENGIKGDWLFYILDFLNLNRFATGQAQPGLSVDVLEKLSIAVPNQESEQQKIAECLSSVDELIAAQARKLDALKTHKKGLMQQLFPREGENQPRLRFPDFQDAGEWEGKLLGDVVKCVKTGKLDANAMVENGQYRFYTCAKNYYQIDDYAFEGEALLVAGNGAHLGYIHHYIGKFNAYQRTYVLQKFEAHVVFLRYLLDRYLPSRILSEKKDGNTPYIVLSTITEMPLLIPQDHEEQKRIADCLTTLDDLIAAQTQNLDALTTHKKGLMQQLFPSPEEVQA
jgi:type I restriction enzyme S subunit